MRRWIEARAGRLIAGFGILVAGTMTGCTNMPTLPGTRSPNTNQNIPKTAMNSGTSNVNAGGTRANVGNGGQPTAANNGAMMNNGNALNRTTGAPADPSGRAGLNMGAMASPSGSAGSPPYLTAPLAPPPNGAQPIATNNPGTMPPLQPARYNAPSNAAAPTDLDPTPGAANASRLKDLPAIEPISAASLDKPRNWQKPKSPQMDVDLPTLSGSGPPMPNPRGADQLGPPPGTR